MQNIGLWQESGIHPGLVIFSITEKLIIFFPIYTNTEILVIEKRVMFTLRLDIWVRPGYSMQ